MYCEMADALTTMQVASCSYAQAFPCRDKVGQVLSSAIVI